MATASQEQLFKSSATTKKKYWITHSLDGSPSLQALWNQNRRHQHGEHPCWQDWLGTKKTENRHCRQQSVRKANTKRGRNNLLLKAGLNTSQSRDNGELLEIETQKGIAEVRYDYNMPSGLGLFALTDYNYDGINDSGVNSLLTGIGLAKPVIQNETTELVVALGPSMQWTNGGHECGKDSYCGNAYAGATFTTDLSWQPSKMFKLELNNKFSSAFTPDIKPANNFKAKFKSHPSIYSVQFTSLQYNLIYQSMSTPEVNNSATLQFWANFNDQHATQTQRKPN